MREGRAVQRNPSVADGRPSDSGRRLRDSRSMRCAWPVLTVFIGSTVLLPFEGHSVFGQPLSSAGEYLALVGGTIYPSPTEEPIQDGPRFSRHSRLRPPSNLENQNNGADRRRSPGGSRCSERRPFPRHPSACCREIHPAWWEDHLRSTSQWERKAVSLPPRREPSGGQLPVSRTNGISATLIAGLL